MPVSLDDVLNDFSPVERAEIDRDGHRIIVQNRTLAELRKMLGVTQGALAKALETSQSNVAQIESKADVMVSTVARVVAALGGTLQLIVSLPDREPVALKLAGPSDAPRLRKDRAPGFEAEPQPKVVKRLRPGRRPTSAAAPAAARVNPAAEKKKRRKGS